MKEVSIEDGQLAVVGAADENYAQYLLVAFVSALLNTTDKAKIKFFCLDGGIKPQTKRVMEDKLEKLGSSIVFLTIDGTQYDQFKVIKHLTKVAYYRLSIPSLFQGVTDRVLYIDCDLIVTGDLLQLLQINFDNKPVAAVEDISTSSHMNTGLKRKDYINSGFLLINIDAWNKKEINRKVIEVLEKELVDNDQCAINIALDGEWLRLPLVWNYQSGIYRNKRYIIENYGYQQLIDVIKKPNVIHFVGSDKPWKKVCYHPWEHDYIKYADAAQVEIYKLPELKKMLISLLSFSTIKKYIRFVYRKSQLRNK